jgi:hypothetical protein
MKDIHTCIYEAHTYMYIHMYIYHKAHAHIQLQIHTFQLACIHDEIAKRDSRIDEAEARTIRLERDADTLRNEVVKWRSEAAQTKLELSARQANSIGSGAVSSRQPEKVHASYMHTDMDAAQQLNKVCVCMFACMHVCVHVCMCVCVCIRIWMLRSS